MMGKLGTDEVEAKKCSDDRHGKKFKSFRLGYKAGKRDARNGAGADSEKNPYFLTPEIWSLLRKRARWEAGYQLGHQIGGRKKKRP